MSGTRYRSLPRFRSFSKEPTTKELANHINLFAGQLEQNFLEVDRAVSTDDLDTKTGFEVTVAEIGTGSITSAQIAAAAITNTELNASVIANQDEITSLDLTNDDFLFLDATNTSLKKAATGEILDAVTGDVTFSVAGLAAITSNSIVNADINSSAAIVDSKLATIATAGKVALTALEIDGGTDIGAALTTSDLIIVDDGAGGTNRKAALSRINTLVQTAGGFPLTALDIDGATDIGAAVVDADLFIVDDGAGGTNRKTTAARLATYIESGISGDISISSGTAAIGSGVIVNADISGSAAIDMSKTALSAGTNVTLSSNTLNVDDAFLINSGDDATSGTITSAGLKVNVTAGAGDVALQFQQGGTTGFVVGIDDSDSDTFKIHSSTSLADTSDFKLTAAGAAAFAGEVAAASLDISGDVDVDGTLETDALTIGGVTLAETIADTIGAMVDSNTETGISVTYDDSDNTLDFVIGAGAIVNSMLADDAVGADELASNAVVNASIASGAAIADSKLDTITTANKVGLAALDIDGGTDIGANLVDADLFAVDDGAGGTNRKTAASRIKTYVSDLTLTTAAQTGITSVGTLTGLAVNATGTNATLQYSGSSGNPCLTLDQDDVDAPVFTFLATEGSGADNSIETGSVGSITKYIKVKVGTTVMYMPLYAAS
tara:strand:- start:590 stop:2587 length:1998 start_codon:yes stop_codon:yes gene_type:complete